MITWMRRYETWNIQHEFWIVGLEFWNMKHETRSMRSVTWNMKHETRNIQHITWILKHVKQNTLMSNITQHVTRVILNKESKQNLNLHSFIDHSSPLDLSHLNIVSYLCTRGLSWADYFCLPQNPSLVIILRCIHLSVTSASLRLPPLLSWLPGGICRGGDGGFDPQHLVSLQGQPHRHKYHPMPDISFRFQFHNVAHNDIPTFHQRRCF